MADHETKSEDERKPSSVYYEQLGAPGLCYRNRETYTLMDEDPRLSNAAAAAAAAAASVSHRSKITPKATTQLFLESQESLHRSTARWYYPIDYHLLCHSVPQLPSSIRRICRAFIDQPNITSTNTRPTPDATATKGRRRQSLVESTTHDESTDDDTVVDDDIHERSREGNKGHRPSDTKTEKTWRSVVDDSMPSLKERNAAVKEALHKEKKNPVYGLQLEARAHMLLTGLQEGVQEATLRFHARQNLLAYTQLDANHVPAKVKVRYTQQKTIQTRIHPNTLGIDKMLREQTQMYDRERTNRADPAYMAPFDRSSLQRTTFADMQTRLLPRHNNSTSSTAESNLPSSLQAMGAVSIPRDDPHAPHLFGNCLALIACQCGVCINEQGSPVVCLLHPVGPLQDRVRLSHLKLPNYRPKQILVHKTPREHIPEEICIDDRLRQLQQCGRNPYMFVARTDLHCTVFSITFVKPKRIDRECESSCWGAANLTLLHRIDCRTMLRGGNNTSYRPIDVACHPRFGIADFTPGKVCIAYESNNGERNVVHHLQIGSSGAWTGQKHIISNLQDISQIEFSSNHPMVLWTSARSYVRPAITATYCNKRPKIGHGYSLYSIDLRLQNKATFQWSPSAQEHVPEGIHSISSLRTDWSTPHRLWTSSNSAGKTWEIDTRMPFRAVNTWSLPHMCDQTGVVLPSTGLYGAGFHFSSPSSFGPTDNAQTCQASPDPVLGMETSPGAHGLHLYQRPVHSSRFQTKSVECVACPTMRRLGNVSMATSLVFPLPDVSDRVFTCGLASFKSHTRDFSRTDSLVQLGFSPDEKLGILSIFTLTNKGDVYSHTLVETTESRVKRTHFNQLPLGCTVLPTPEISDSTDDGWNVLRVPLANDFPLPSQSINPATTSSLFASNTIDLSSFTKNDAQLPKIDKLRDLPMKVQKSSVVVNSHDVLSAHLHLPRHLVLVDNQDHRTDYFCNSHTLGGNGTSSECKSDLTQSVLTRTWQDETDGSMDQRS